jgi:hypothetical protein
MQKFTQSVARHFPAKQAALIETRLTDRRGLEQMPVNEFMSLLVKNG